jgi:hypothetical protein
LSRRTASSGTRPSLPLDRVAAFVPDPLPPNPTQACGEGVRVSLRFDDGEVTDYGPCTLPTGIEPLRARLVAEGLKRQGLKIQRGGPRCSRDVIADWYKDGRIDSVYRLRCYQEALDALPGDGGDPGAALRRARTAAAVGRLAG